MPGSGRSRHAAIVLVPLLLGWSEARGDYESHPELRPEVRCAALADPSSATGYSPDCQPLFWDLPAATHVGQREAARYDASRGFAGGLTDRPPPLYTDGTSGFETPGPGRRALCPLGGDPWVRDPDVVPYWKPTGEMVPTSGPYGPTESPVYEVACRRGTRAHVGPWFFGTDRTRFDLLARKIVRFENSGRLDRDVAAGRIRAEDRREFEVSSEIYTHPGSHHGTVHVSSDRCNDWHDPAYAASGECAEYRALADRCPAEAEDTFCPDESRFDFTPFRATTARQGRQTLDLPEKVAFGTLEDQIWLLFHHLIADEPPLPGSTRRRNFRSQKNGPVGEAVIQIFTEPLSAGDLVPASITFDDLVDAATTFVPPFTLAVHDRVWYAPFDAAVGVVTLHSHENMVKATTHVVPPTAARSGAVRRECGGTSGALPNPNVYENYSYLEPEVCEYWRDADGPLILRKGQALHMQCVVNNGVTPTEKIDDPEVRSAIEDGPIGRDLLYGRQDRSAYRVRYGCEVVPGVPPGTPLSPARVCPENPAVDDRGRPLDGPYDAPADCPMPAYTGRCVPANVVFANTGEDSMCISIITYWPLSRLVNADGSLDDTVLQDAQNGRTDRVGTPGRLPQSPSDDGTCDDGAGDRPGIPSPLAGSHCRAGL
jgi:hypothetical protein